MLHHRQCYDDHNLGYAVHSAAPKLNTAMHEAVLVSSQMTVLSSMPAREIHVSRARAGCPQHGQQPQVSGKTLLCVLAFNGHMQCARVYDSIATVIAAFFLHPIMGFPYTSYGSLSLIGCWTWFPV